MATLASPYKITADGDYDLQNLTPGREYLLTLKGTWESNTVTLSFFNPNRGDYEDVEDASWTADTEQRLVAVSSLMRINSNGASGGDPEIFVTLIPIL